MDSFRILLIVCIAGCAMSYATARASGATPEQELELKSRLRSELSWRQRVLLFIASQLQPEPFHGLPMREYLFEDYEHQFIDAAFVDLRSILFQAKSWPATTELLALPDMDHTEILDFCFLYFCINWEINVDTKNTTITGLKDVTSDLEITPNSIKNTYSVPHLKWSSPGWHFNITDLNYYTQHLYRDSHMSCDGMRTSFEANYAVVPHLGLQLSNLSIDFSLASNLNYLADYTILNPDGTMERTGPYLAENAKYAMVEWDRYAGNYSRDLLFRINCVLSNGRVDPIECAEGGDYYDHIGYYKMNAFQLIETLGLASRY